MLRFFKIVDGLINELDIPDADILTRHQEADWIDAQEPTEEERQVLQGLLKTDIPEFDDVEEIEASARCFVDQAGVHVHSLFLTQSDGRHSTVSVACILLRMRARRGQVEAGDPAELLVTLLEQKVENHADGLEDLHRQLEEVSYLVLEDEDAELDEAINRLARLEDSNGKTRLCLMDTQRNLSFLLRHLRRQGDLQETLREINRDIETLMSHTTFLFDKINFLMDSTQGFINIEQNQIIKIFSIAAVVFLPPTLIASIYGMNFQHMPELEWLAGYPAALGLMVAAAFAPYWYFKRKGWL